MQSSAPVFRASIVRIFLHGFGRRLAAFQEPVLFMAACASTSPSSPASAPSAASCAAAGGRRFAEATVERSLFVVHMMSDFRRFQKYFDACRARAKAASRGTS